MGGKKRKNKNIAKAWSIKKNAAMSKNVLQTNADLKK